MKIKNIYIENFRSIKNATIDCVGYNSFVGANGAGKSTVLDALNIFFGVRNSFTEDDFSDREINREIVIKVTFHELSDAAKDTFDHYVRNGELAVATQLIADETGNIKKIVRGERLVFPAFVPFFDEKKAADQKIIFNDLRSKYPSIDNSGNQAGRIAAVRDFEESIDESEKELRLSGEEFFGVSKGVNRFQKHIHWVYVPAVKEAVGESEEGKTSYLGELIQHTVKSEMDYENKLDEIKETALTAYGDLLDNQQQHLDDLQNRLSERLKQSVTSKADLGLSWKKDNKSVSVADPTAKVVLQDKGFAGEVDNFGHGLQRAFLIVILQELAASDSDVTPTLLLGCEEPELYQHPPQAKHLSSLLMEMSKGDAQIFVTTHSPYFIDVEYYDGIKMFRNTGAGVTISASNFSEILSEYNSAFEKTLKNNNQIKTKLSVQTLPKYNEIFFSEKVVLVEGISDQVCLEAYLRLSGKRSLFQRSGVSIVVCEGKSSLVLMQIIAKKFEIPHYIIFDCDSHCKEAHKTDHIRDNSAILKLANHAALEDFPTADIEKENLTGWLTDIEGMLEEEFGDEKDGIIEAGRNAVGHIKNCKKYPLYVATVMSDAWERGKTFPTLERVVNQILQ